MTLLGERVGNIEVVLVVVHHGYGCVESKLGLLEEVRWAVHGDRDAPLGRPPDVLVVADDECHQVRAHLD